MPIRYEHGSHASTYHGAGGTAAGTTLDVGAGLPVSDSGGALVAPANGRVRGMSTKKVTVSFDSVALRLAERAAAREGLSVSAWVSRAARREAVRTGVGPGHSRDLVLSDALTDEAELTAAEEDMRAAG
jgi:hypothetical protein